MRKITLLLSLSFVVAQVQGYTSKKPPFLTSRDMCGIWRLKIDPLQQRDDNDRLLDKMPTNTNQEVEFALRLNEDGTFDPYTTMDDSATTFRMQQLEGYQLNMDLQNLIGRGGCWDYRDQCLLLATDRSEKVGSANIKDTVFEGKILAQVSERLNENEGPIEREDSSNDNTITDIDVHLSIPYGRISTGKFFYPNKHSAFFDQPMLFEPSVTGTFCMNQLLGKLNTRIHKEERDKASNTKAAAKYHKRDFYNRTFYLTDTPHPVNPGYAAQDLYYDESKATLDIRVMPITFHPNDTFSTIGSGKILRGRYGITGKERDALWFQVSLFGAGRSAPGSVFSEGKLLSQDDRRGYVGPIQAYSNKHNETTYFVDGEYFYGTDLKRARKPNSMGTFTLQEIDEKDEEVGYDDVVSNVKSGESDSQDWEDGGNVFQ